MKGRIGLNVAHVCIWLLGASVAGAQAPHADRPRVREIFVPFDELKVVLEGQPQRVFLTRREFNDLLAKARHTPEQKYPHQAAVLSADYSGTVETGRARVHGTLVIDVLAEGLHALPLDFSGVGLLTAQLDDKPAPLGLAEGNKVVLLVEGQGRHRLELELVVPLETTAALQSLRFQLPVPAATQFSLTVPGNVEVRSGADVIQRTVDPQGAQTRLQLVLKPGVSSLVMTLNNRLLLKQQVVVARSVQVSEITSAYERLHASVSLSVLHGAVEKFSLVPPAGFEVTEVSSPLLAQWVVTDVEGRAVLEARMSEPTNETVVLNISAVRTPAVLDNWTWPRMDVLNVEAHSAVLGLLLEDRLQAHSIVAQGLLRIDNRVLTDALPPSMLEAEPGAPRVRPIVAYYSPQAAFALSAGFEQPPVRLNVTTTALLTLNEKSHQLRGSFALLPEREKLFALDFSAPQDWKITSVTNSAGQALSFELYPAEDNRTRVHVPLPGVPAGQTHNVFFQATHTPAGWLEDWTTAQAAFPVFRVEGAARDVGAIGVRATDDMVVRPETLTGLTPLDEREKARFALADIPTDLVYRYDASPFNAALAIQRTAPRITARVYNFLRIDHERIVAHYELVYDIAEAHARRLRLSLPASTPANLAIRGLDGVNVTEFTSDVEGDSRNWSVVLDQRRQGRVRLAVDFEDRFSIVDRAGRGLPQDFSLPLVRADQVSYQSGVVAVEGSAELDVEIVTHPRKIDVGELVDAEYQPGRRLLGAFGYLGDAGQVTVRVARHPGYVLPPTIVQRAELVTLVSVHGLMQTAARYQLRTKAQFLELQLPAGSTLWSTFLDGTPGQPQRDGERILLSLPPAAEETLRDLQVVYETPADRIALWHTIEAAAPRLFLRTAEGAVAREVPTADLVWHLHVPEGYRLTRTGGTVHTDQLVRRPPPLARVGATLYMLAGGIGGGLPLPGQAAKETASAVAAIASEPANHVGLSDGSQTLDGLMRTPEEFDVAKSQQSAPNGNQSWAAPRGWSRPAASTEAPRSESTPLPAPAAPPTAMPSESKAAGETAASQNFPALTSRLVEGEGSPGDKAGKDVAASSYWALQGVRSLKIDLEPLGSAVTFQSLGEDPRLEATMANRTRLTALAWGVCLLIGLYGLRLTHRPTRVKFRYVTTILLISALLPLVGDWFDELAETFDLAFLTAFLLIPYYMAAAAMRWAMQRLGSVARLQPVTAASVAILAVLLVGNSVWAQQGTVESGAIGSPAKPIDEILAELEKLVVSGKPVDVPKDALVVPYEGMPNLEADPAQKLLVPYEQYVELWNRAFPDQKILARPLPATHALAGARYEATLVDGENLLIRGVLHVDVFGTDMVAIPLALEGGVLARATIDGQPARLRVPEVAAPPVSERAAAKSSSPQPPPGNWYVLHVIGKGRKQLNLEIRLKLDRQGGWRVAAGRLPAAPATSLEVTAPLAQTEIRLNNIPDRRAYETTKANETIQTALSAGGQLQLQWRPKVGEGQVDQSLTADSTAVLDVREDGLRLHWQMKLEFRRGQREVFTLRLPANYLVERVTGANIRGWEVKDVAMPAGEQELHITLLKAARDREELGLVLSRRMSIGQAEAPQELEAPVVRAADAVLHHGRLLVRRSSQLELRVTEITGLSRTDSPMDQATLPISSIADESPLGIRPLAAYQFISTPYTLRLEAHGVPTTGRVRVQTLLKLTEQEAKLESRLLLAIEGRPLFRVRILLPLGLKLDEVIAPGAFERAVTDAEGRQLLTVYLATGQAGEVPLVVRGTLAKPAAAENWQLPNLQVLDFPAVEGQLVVQTDPAFDVRTSQLQNVESVLLDRTFHWLAAEQRPLARVALGYRGNDYAGQLELVARQPRVRSFSVTNVRVTDRAIEETILLEFIIREAGIRQLSFLLPEALKDARISAPLLRQKTVEAAAGGRVRVQLDLQDEVMGQLRVLIEHDQLLTNQPHEAPLPVVETGTTDVRYVTVESAGRDEVLIDEPQGLDVLSRQLGQWRTLTSLLGTEITQAYLVRDTANQPRLTIRTKDRTAVETAGARIGLAETTLLVDSQGAYRGLVVFHVDNSTEQFLDVALPAGARLWSVRVAEEGVKPTQAATGGPSDVRVPLIKTAAGDQEYRVVIKYGGRMDSITSMSEVSFPLVRTVNINVELSQVRLFLPQTHHWFDFGGTMTRVSHEGDLAAGFLAYQNRQIERLSQILSSQDAYSRARAANNLKQLKLSLNQPQQYGYEADAGVQRQQIANSVALEAAEQVIQQQAAEQKMDFNDNRARFNDLYSEQENTRSKNVVQDLGSNFFDADASMPATPRAGKESFNPEWLEQNKLSKQNAAKGEAVKKPGAAPGDGANRLDFDPARPANPGQPQAAGLMLGGEVQAGQKRDDFSSNEERDRKSRELQRQDETPQQLRRYQQRLEEQTQVPAPQGQQPAAGGAPGGYGGGVGNAPSPNAAATDPLSADRQKAKMALGDRLSRDGRADDAELSSAQAEHLVVPVSLASLDVELPSTTGYREVFFTTPRGDVQITARPLATRISQRVGRLGWVAGVLTLAGLVYLVVRRYGASFLARRSTAVLMLAIGALSLATSVLPIAGLLLAITGAALFVGSLLPRRALIV